MKHLLSNHNATTLGPLFDSRAHSLRVEEPPNCKLDLGDSGSTPDAHTTSPQIPNGRNSTTGQQLKEKGLALVRENNENWMDRCLAEVTSYLTTAVMDDCDFTGEDLRFYCQETVGLPKHPNAFGALINTLIKRKIIVPTGEHRQMKDRSSHARSTPVYKAN